MLPTHPVGPFHLPTYPAISISQWDQHLSAAFEQAQSRLRDLESPDLPCDFEHSFLALERLRATLVEQAQLFFAAKAPHATPDKEALAQRWAKEFSELETRIYQGSVLFERCQAASQAWTDAPVAERRLMDRHLRAFKEAGLELDEVQRAHLAQVNGELAALGQQFQALCQQAGSVVVVLPEAAAAGLSEQDAQAARALAAAQGASAGLGFVLQPMAVDGWLASMEDADCRRQLWEACVQRGSGVRDERSEPIIQRILELRTHRAHLLGYPTCAHHLMEETMAAHPDAAMALVMDTWEKLQPALRADLDALKELAVRDGIADLNPWDVPYYATRHRQEAFGFDERQLRQYLPLQAVRSGAFDAASQLFGLQFRPVPAQLYHPDAQAYLVNRSGTDQPVGLLIVDDYLRDTKAPGAWMDNLRPPGALDGPVAPWVINVCNFPRPEAGRPTLLDMEDATTVFHELGHALHSLLTTARYPSQAGTNVAQDFVELPSQIMENWVREPQALRQVARHWETGEPIPDHMVDDLVRSRRFGQGIFLAQYLASAYLDLALHSLDHPCLEDLAQFQAQAMAQLALPDGIAPRHGLLHFSHLFSGDAYAAGYYSYLWAEVLEADAFGPFRDAGLFDPGLASALQEHVFAPGSSLDPADTFAQLMGREPDPQALLAKHGLLGSPTAASTPARPAP